MQVILSDVSDMPVQLLDLLDLLVPVARKLYLPAKGTLQLGEFLLGIHESVDRLYVRTVRQSNHLLYPKIDPRCFHGRMYRIGHFYFRLNRYVPSGRSLLIRSRS